jgi:hypothetical protein
VDYYRYHPLILNAAFLGGLSAEDYRILGLGDKRNYMHAFVREPSFPRTQSLCAKIMDTGARWNSVQERIIARGQRLFGR